MPDRDPVAVSFWLLTTADAAWSCQVLGPVPISGDDRPHFTLTTDREIQRRDHA